MHKPVIIQHLGLLQ